MRGYLSSGKESDCTGCGACHQICNCNAISMVENKYGFIYPQIDAAKCIKCGLCRKICPMEHEIIKHQTYKLSFGGYINDKIIREKSTSGGAFTAICRAFCDKNYVIYGASSERLLVFHKYVVDIANVEIFHSSKYAQSLMGKSYSEIRNFLKNGKKVLFSGTPCQVAGLYSFLNGQYIENLLTIEVLCTGIPSALFVKKYNEWCIYRYGAPISNFNYRYTGKNKWDDQPTYAELENGKKIITDRWFSKFYSIFLQRLMSRPACNACRFVSNERVADITLSDLWGVDREYPDLYDNGAGSSWVICNSQKGYQIFMNAKKEMTGHKVDFEKMRKYQRPGMIQKTVHPQYDEFMADLLVMNYTEICKKWAKNPSMRLLFQKKVWNNRNRVKMWKLKRKLSSLLIPHKNSS